MRDIVITLFVLGLVPAVLVRPHIGLLLWAWIGYMNPHRFTYGFAYDFPFAQIVALATFAGLIFSKEKLRLPMKPVTIVLFLFLIWMTVTSVFALDDEAWDKWEKVVKIQLMTFITMVAMREKRRVEWLIWVIVVSIGFFGVKGGIFTLATGGGYHVLGPLDSFISGNTEIGLALIMTLPLMRYLQLHEERRWMRWALGAAMLLCAVAVLGTQSRGALLGGAAMAAMFWVKSRKKLVLALVLLAAIPPMIAFMPHSWSSRMDTIRTYEEDQSAMGRIIAWRFGYRIASERWSGGGFGTYANEYWEEYAPDIVQEGLEIGFLEGTVGRAAHSIYFDVLGEHGFVGLFLFLMLGFLTWRTASETLKATIGRSDLQWIRDLTGMLQVSLVAYAVGGAFLSLAYFDLAYHLLALIVVLNTMTTEALAAELAPHAPKISTDRSAGLAIGKPGNLHARR